MGDDLPELGELEREVMQLVWLHAPITAEMVRERLDKPLKESTVRTVLRRLEEKGFTHSRYPDRIVLVGIADMQGRPSTVAEARYVLNGDGASAEFGIAATDAWQRRGIGSALLHMIEQAAAAAGVTRLSDESLATNDTFLSFARSCGFAVRCDNVDCSILRVEKQVRAPPRWGPGSC
jgi:BlaI family transcriptional regulator, penicillinase repressor